MADKTRVRRTWQRSRKVAVPALVAVLVIAAVFVLSRLEGRDEQPPPPQAPVVNVTVMELEPIPRLLDTVTLNGSVEPWATVNIAAETAGAVTNIALEEGARVPRGQPLVYLEDDLLRATYAQAKAAADFDARELERITIVEGRGVATEMEIDRVRSTAAVSQAAMERAAAELRRAVIRAPRTIHGAANDDDYVGRLNEMAVEVGEYLQPGRHVAQIVDTHVVKVMVDIPELDVRHIDVGQEVTVIVRALDDREITGTIHFIKLVADPRTRTYRAEVKAPNPDGAIRPGMVVDVRLLRRVLSDVIMIPLDAVIPLENDYEVFISLDGRAERRLVSLAGSLIQGRHVEVRPPAEGRGLQAGDRLIIAGQRDVGDGQRIRERPPAQELLADMQTSPDAPTGPAEGAIDAAQ